MTAGRYEETTCCCGCRGERDSVDSRGNSSSDELLPGVDSPRRKMPRLGSFGVLRLERAGESAYIEPP